MCPFVYFFVPKRYEVEMSDKTHRLLTIEEISSEVNLSIDEVKKLYEKNKTIETTKWLVKLYNQTEKWF